MYRSKESRWKFDGRITCSSSDWQPTGTLILFFFFHSCQFRGSRSPQRTYSGHIPIPDVNNAHFIATFFFFFLSSRIIAVSTPDATSSWPFTVEWKTNLDRDKNGEITRESIESWRKFLFFFSLPSITDT